MASQDSYQYQPLGLTNQQIRLLRILQKSLSPKRIISCTLQTADHRVRGGCYYAVSYTWGPPHPTKRIMIDGKRFEVRENLWSFLQLAQEKFPDHLLWLDQICIEQSNATERNHQVQLMSNIYKNASIVLAWLGPAADDSDWAMDFIRLESWRENPKNIPRRTRNAIRRLFSRAYWSRLWVVQELKLGRNTLFLCGTKQLYRGELRQFVSAVTQGRFADSDLINPYAATLLMDTSDLVQMHINRVGASHIPSKLRSLSCLSLYLGGLMITVATFSDFHCADPRDKIYGLLGLGREQERILVDYNKTVEDVFWDFFKYSFFRSTPMTYLTADITTDDSVRKLWARTGVALMHDMGIYCAEKEAILFLFVNEGFQKPKLQPLPPKNNTR